eukprot:SAG22_NODE_2481_length_2528_cov_2.864553_2_plen_87_part_00
MDHTGSERTKISVSFHLPRKAGFYMYKVLLPLYMVNALSYQVYFFHPSEHSNRVGTTATYFLAAFAMLFVIGAVQARELSELGQSC